MAIEIDHIQSDRIHGIDIDIYLHEWLIFMGSISR